MQVTYFHHSGVMVELDKHILIFDYYTEGGRYDFLQNPDWKQKDVFVFVSHAHADHYDDRILAWKDDVQYIVSDDVIMKKSDNVTTISPHQTKTVQGVEIKTLQSNDEGVAFLGKTEGKTRYHAGKVTHSITILHKVIAMKLICSKGKPLMWHLYRLTQDWRTSSVGQQIILWKPLVQKH